MIYRIIKKILAENLNVEEEDILPETELAINCRSDAVNVARLIIECEKSFKITINDEDVHTFKCVKDLVYYIRKLQFDD